MLPISSIGVFFFFGQILVPSKGLLTCYSRVQTHTHYNMHLIYNMEYHPIATNVKRSYHSSSKECLYPWAANTSRHEQITNIIHEAIGISSIFIKVFIKHVRLLKHGIAKYNQTHHPTQMHVKIHMHDLPQLSHCIITLVHQYLSMFLCMFMLLNQSINPNN